jgi:hypothetical protein
MMQRAHSAAIRAHCLCFAGERHETARAVNDTRSVIAPSGIMMIPRRLECAANQETKSDGVRLFQKPTIENPISSMAPVKRPKLKTESTRIVLTPLVGCVRAIGPKSASAAAVVSYRRRLVHSDLRTNPDSYHPRLESFELTRRSSSLWGAPGDGRHKPPASAGPAGHPTAASK